MSSNYGKLIVISAPSGTGKGTVINELIKKRPDFVFSISATTRPPRPHEIDGIDYHFLTKESFNEMISNDGFLEHAEYVGNYYGTPISPIKDHLKNKRTVLLDIEVQGAKQVMVKMPEAISIFIVPPDMAELERRLRGRGTDSEEKLAKRLEQASLELKQKDNYAFVVVNDNVDRVVNEILSLIDRKE